MPDIDLDDNDCEPDLDDDYAAVKQGGKSAGREKGAIDGRNGDVNVRSDVDGDGDDGRMGKAGDDHEEDGCSVISCLDHSAPFLEIGDCMLLL